MRPKVPLTPQRLQDLREMALFFWKKPFAASFLTLPKKACFLLLALTFSEIEEFLDPQGPHFLAKILAKINFWEEVLKKPQGQGLLPTLPQNLADLLREWQAAKGKKTPFPRQKLGDQIEQEFWVIWEENRQKALEKRLKEGAKNQQQILAQTLVKEFSLLATRKDLPLGEQKSFQQVFRQSGLGQRLQEEILQVVFARPELRELSRQTFQEKLTELAYSVSRNLNRGESLGLSEVALKKLALLVTQNSAPYLYQIFTLEKLGPLCQNPESLRQNFSQIRQILEANLKNYLGEVFSLAGQNVPTVPKATWEKVIPPVINSLEAELLGKPLSFSETPQKSEEKVAELLPKILGQELAKDPQTAPWRNFVLGLASVSDPPPGLRMTLAAARQSRFFFYQSPRRLPSVNLGFEAQGQAHPGVLALLGPGEKLERESEKFLQTATLSPEKAAALKETLHFLRQRKKTFGGVIFTLFWPLKIRAKKAFFEIVHFLPPASLILAQGVNLFLGKLTNFLAVAVGLYKVNEVGLVESLPRFFLRKGGLNFQAFIGQKFWSFLGPPLSLGRLRFFGFLGKFTRLGIIFTGLKTSWEIFKKGALALGASLLLTLLTLGWAAFLGAVVGGLIGGVVGAIIGAKIGASIGATIGTAILPGVGTVVGGFLGGLIGGIIGFFVGAGIGAAIGTAIGWFFPKVILAPANVLFNAAATINSLFSGSSVSASAVASTTTLPVVGAVAAPTAVILVSTVLIAQAFISGPEEELFAGSPYLEIEKTAQIGNLSGLNFPNSVVDNQELVQYNLRVSAKEKTLTGLKVTEETKVTSKVGGSFLVTQDSAGNPIGPWDQENEPLLKELLPGQTWSKSYAFYLEGEKFKDAVISNTVSVESAEGEKKSFSLTLTIGTPPASSCPLKNAYLTCGSYGSSFSLCPDGHGGNAYWAGTDPKCYYAMGGYYGPDYDSSSICYQTYKNNPQLLGPTYGFAIDLGGGGPGAPVYLPQIFGKNLFWDFVAERKSNNGAWGWARIYAAKEEENFSVIELVHIEEGGNQGKNLPSGTEVGTLFNWGANTHLHLELRINDRYVRPEFLCQ